MAKTEKLFDESSWEDIVNFLPNDEVVRRVALDDFIWFISRPKKYKNPLQKMEDYIRHLRLKSNANFALLSNNSEIFRTIDIDILELELRKIYKI